MRERLLNIPYDVCKYICNEYADSGIPNVSKTHWLDDRPNIILIRCNPIYVTNDMQPYDDWMVVANQDKIEVFEMTVDPKTRRKGIANLMPQVYYGNIRPHNWVDWRLAVCQDFCKLWVRRFDTKQSTLYQKYCDENNLWYYDDFGLHHINIHGAWWKWSMKYMPEWINTSLGCAIHKNEKVYRNVFVPILKSVSKDKINYIPVFVIQLDYLDMKANAIDGQDFMKPNSKKAVV